MKISADFFDKYNKQGPRYTSYPPATAFHTNFSDADFIKALDLSNNEQSKNISIYIHIPFCLQRCHFCGCNTTLFESDEKVFRYIQCLKKEIKTISQHIDKKRVVTQIHWGGGTPNAISLLFVEEVMNLLKSEFVLADFCEVAMECNPAYLNFSDIDKLAEIGFNRMSLGIQDFHTNVLDAVNRKSPKQDVAEILSYLRKKRFRGVNIDLIYGLPLQTLASFQENIQKAIELKPDRLVTFSYAHVPWFNSAQKNIEKFNFPTPEEKLNMLVYAINTLTENGYESIGMDHFALPNDDLAIAKHNKSLHRNFQGYCTKKTTGQVYAFGCSSISQLGSCYAQNIKSTDKYMDAIENNGMAIERGYLLSEEECIIRDVINEIMCNGFINFEEIALKHQKTVEDLMWITQFNPLNISELIADRMLTLSENTLQVNELGMMIVRNIAMAFDPQVQNTANRHSQTI